jgi:hypothetical protein
VDWLGTVMLQRPAGVHVCVCVMMVEGNRGGGGGGRELHCW